MIWDQKKQTSEQRVVDTLRRDIIAGKLPVGEFLSQRKLAEWTETSVISVRGALRQLENEGLVENIPQKGVRIPKENEGTLRDRYFVRTILETSAVNSCFGQIQADTAAELRKMAQELDQLANEPSTKNAPAFAKLHQEFHLLIARTTGSPLLVKLLRRVINPSLMLLNATRSWQSLSEQVKNHVALVDAILGDSREKAVQAIQEHIQTGFEHELKTL
jgi:DNA-binding GntR family transcriptional regulator